MSDFGDIAISKIVNHIPTDMNQFLMIKFSEKWLSKIIFFQKFKKIDEKIFKNIYNKK